MWGSIACCPESCIYVTHKNGEAKEGEVKNV